ncbi:MAG: hypothetical protein V7751_20855 [Pseudoalteromonas distincta]
MNASLNLVALEQKKHMDKIRIEEFDPIIEPAADKVHRIARASVVAVPVIGGALVELVNAIVAPPYEVRTNAWLNQLSETLNCLIEGHNQTEIQLRDNEVLLSAIIRSSDIAVRTSSPKVTKALSNGLIYVALNQNLEEAIIAIYLNSISRLTSLHLKLLEYLSRLPELERNIQASASVFQGYLFLRSRFFRSCYCS